LSVYDSRLKFKCYFHRETLRFGGSQNHLFLSLGSQVWSTGRSCLQGSAVCALRAAGGAVGPILATITHIITSIWFGDRSIAPGVLTEKGVCGEVRAGVRGAFLGCPQANPRLWLGVFRATGAVTAVCEFILKVWARKPEINVGFALSPGLYWGHHGSPKWQS
jgi:hypothetical protein